MNKKRTLLIALAVCGVALVGLRSHVRSGVRTSASPTRVEPARAVQTVRSYRPRRVERDAAMPVAPDDGTIYCFMGDSGLRARAFSSKRFSVSLWAEEFAPGVRIETAETVPESRALAAASWLLGAGVTPGYHVHKVTFPTEFEPVECAVEHPGSFYVVGHDIVVGSDGEDALDESSTIIEHWTLTYPRGWPYMQRVPAPDPIGVVSPHSTIRARLSGLVYKLPKDRDDPTLKRQLVTRLPFRAAFVEADPQGRYLLVGNPDGGELLQIELVGPDAPRVAVIAEASEFPLLRGLTSMSRDRIEDGVKRFYAGSSTREVLILEDVTNDGVLALRVMPRAEFSRWHMRAVQQGKDDFQSYVGILGF